MGCYGMLLTKVFKAHNIDLSDEIVVVMENKYTGTLSPTACSLHHYRMSGSPTKQSSRSRNMNSSLFDMCCEIEKKMDDFFEEFKTAMLGINSRLDAF